MNTKLEMATDLYQLSVGNVHAIKHNQNKIATFDMFVRKNPFAGGYSVFAGLEQVVDYIRNLHFASEDVDFIAKNHPEFRKEFLDYLKNFRFSGDIYALNEGELFFPGEPILRVSAPIIEAQLIETPLLAMINHQSLIATKASRITRSAGGHKVMEFGLRRAHGTHAGLYGARAAILAGCVGTSDLECEFNWDTVSMGTMSHAYVMSYESELEAFYDFAYYNPNNAIVLVDTYDTLKEGVPHAIEAFNRLKADGVHLTRYGIRLDSGDLAYLSAKAREMLDSAGHRDASICASSDLDEYLIADLRLQGAKIDTYGVGTKMITAYDWPALGGVYKLSQIEDETGVHRKMKFSDDPIKITNPGKKKVVRFYDKESAMASADLIMLEEEAIPTGEPFTIYHPLFPYKKRVLKNYEAKEILHPVFQNGRCLYEPKPLSALQNDYFQAISKFWPQYLRLYNPNEFHVDISDGLYDVKKQMMQKHQKL